MTPLILLATTTASALPLYDMATSDRPLDACKTMNTVPGEGAVWDNFAAHIDDRVYIYLAEDFASVYNSRGVGTITQDQARSILQRSMEVWNREARGPVLVFEGGHLARRR